MSDPVSVLPEPFLEFGHGQMLTDPRDGLSLFGPYDLSLPQHPRQVSYAVVGTDDGIDAFITFATAMQGPLVTSPGHRLWPYFPGFEAALNSVLPATPTRTFRLEHSALDAASRKRDPHERAHLVVEHYLTQIRRLVHADDRVDVIVCLVPDYIHDRCRVLSRIPEHHALGEAVSAKQRRDFARGQQSLFGPRRDPRTYQLSADFRRQLKALVMEHDLPVQIIRESTLRLDEESARESRRRSLTPLSDRAWNLAIALYYKAGGKPWRLATARDGVCYIGLAFRLQPDTQSKTQSAACAAQMFLDSGDGIVFMGRFGPWFSPDTRLFQLSRSAAADLLRGTLQTYQEQEGKPLKEVFLHCRSGISAEAFQGFQDACPRGVKLVGIRVRRSSDSYRLMREGRYPVLRGTLWTLSERSCLLWGSGFKPRIGTYDGTEMPVPLRIDVQHGEADITQVAQDILGLTKLNYNACRLGESEPVTIGFSDQVGEIIVSNPGATIRRPQFRFYT